MADQIVYILSAFCGLLVVAMIYLWRKMSRLDSHLVELQDILASHEKDLTGLCSAAVVIDNKVNSNDIKLQEMDGKINIAPSVQETGTDDSTGYQEAIEKIRDGADAQELVNNYGLSVEEANLLTRLHK